MKRARTMRIIALVAVCAALASCGALREDETKLRGFMSATQGQPRIFTYIEASATRWLRLDVRVSDDLKYEMKLTSARGPVFDAIIADDAMYMHVLNAKLLQGLPVSFGNPATFGLLAAHRWVEDPAGAPPLAQPRTDLSANAPPPDPFSIAQHLFNTLTDEIATSAAIVRFNPDSIEYKPSQDPWMYPDRAKNQDRYDYIRPRLPIRQPTGGTNQFQLNEAFFRKTSAFVQNGRIYQACEMVDIVDHEEFVKQREQHIVNPYLTRLYNDATQGQTLTPIRPRSVFISIAYPPVVPITLPPHPAIARLDGFTAGLRSSFTTGLLSPAGGALPTQCLRPESESIGGLKPIIPTSFATPPPLPVPSDSSNPAGDGSGPTGSESAAPTASVSPSPSAS